MQQFAALLRKDSRPVRYLVVDDSVFARKNLIKMIEMFGGEVAGEAGDGLTAIAEYNRTKPDIVLMDITMPQMEGIEAVERIVRQHAEARAPHARPRPLRRLNTLADAPQTQDSATTMVVGEERSLSMRW